MQKSEFEDGSVPKIMLYDYFFNYSGEEITGACVRVAIHVYKNGQEIKFIGEPSTCECFLNEIYEVSLNKNGFSIKKNLYIDNLFRLMFNWDKIDSTVEGFFLEKKTLEKKLSDECENALYPELISMPKKGFTAFLKVHEKGFDRKAQASYARFY